MINSGCFIEIGGIAMDYSELIKMAEEAMQKAYAPYSGFRVGAAVLSGNGRVYTGANIENASYGATCCAERVAIFKAVSEGEKGIQAVAVASSSEETVFPCGICRQVMAEFGDAEMKILCGKTKGEYEVYTLRELLPHSFGLDRAK